MAKKFTIFGDPVEHSISPKMHTFAIEGLGVEATYTKTHLQDGSKLKEIFLKEFDGANVTVPHKEIAYNQCDDVRGIANKIGAVNTILNEDGKMIGYNTDAEGFFKSIENFTDITKILILGAGGTAKAVSAIFLEKDMEVTLLNRSKNRLDFFKNLGVYAYSWDEFEVKSYDLVINTTSAGLQDNSYPVDRELLKEIFSNSKYAVDVIYNKNTPFLELAKLMNIAHKDGSDMLLYQGVLAFDLFYNHKFDIKTVTELMKKVFI
jgi:shikimate dehydrogenase